MKNLLIFISPTGSFDNRRSDITNDAGSLVKIQIENSLNLGWRQEDILLVTNFDFQYGVVKAVVLKEAEFFDRKPQASKINAIIKLFENGMINKKDLYWFHDLDAFQLHPLIESELELTDFDMGLTDYGRWSRWNTGTVFFKENARDIFLNIQEIMYRDKINEEMALGELTRDDESIKNRVKRINKSYNFTPYNFQSCYKLAIKPIRVVHFHPYGTLRGIDAERLLDFYMGENSLGIRLLTDNLIKTFKYHKIR